MVNSKEHIEEYMSKKQDLQEEEIKKSPDEEISADDVTTDSEFVEDEIEVELTPEEEMEAAMSVLREENEALKDQLLRKQADFDNYRKRMAREKQDSIKYGNQRILEDLVDVIDNFERAIKSSVDSKDFENFHQGIIMIEQQFTSMLSSKYGLSRIESVGEEYNPNAHEALMMEDSEEHDVQTVLEDFQSGFMLHDRVLRPSKVKIAKPVTAVEKEDQDIKED